MSESKNLIFSTKNSKVKKYVDPHSMQFMLHASPPSIYDSFVEKAEFELSFV